MPSTAKTASGSFSEKEGSFLLSSPYSYVVNSTIINNTVNNGYLFNCKNCHAVYSNFFNNQIRQISTNITVFVSVCCFSDFVSAQFTYHSSFTFDPIIIPCTYYQITPNRNSKTVIYVIISLSIFSLLFIIAITIFIYRKKQLMKKDREFSKVAQKVLSDFG